MAVVFKLLVLTWLVAVYPGVVTGLAGWKCRTAADAYSYWCFKLVTSSTNWVNANNQCKAQSATLATIRDSTEANWVTSNMGMTGSTWFGLNDRSKEGTFRFSEDEKGEYVNFQPGEPNGGGGEDCVVMVKSWGGKWADVGCSGSYNYACSRPLGASGSCLSGWTRSGSECYMVTYTSRNFDSARTKCLDAGGDLARLYDSSQNSYLNGKIGSTHLWIGYNDKRQEGKWVWSVEDTMFTYWNPGEPNNSGNEDCAEFYGSGGSKGKWNDYPCTATRRIICKKYKDGNCPSGWHSYRERCYYFHSGTLTWTKGRDLCRNLGANYISIDDTTENNYLMGKVSATNYWIGGNDIVTEGTWTWKTDGGLSYTKWGSGQPDNSNNEDCGEFYKSGSTWYWNDNNCNNNNHYLCKRAIPYCGDPGSVSHASKSGSSYFQDDKVTYNCNSGYASGGSVTCQSSSKWTTKPTCNKVNCGNPGTPSNSQKSGTTYTYGATVSYSCKTGYQKTGGHTSRQCQANKSWSNSAIVCSKVSCGNPGTPSNSAKSGTTYTYGASVSYSCNSGYERTGGHTSRTCQSNKAWSNSAIVCSKVSCGNPGTPTGGQKSGSSYKYQDKVTFTCNAGHVRSGATSTTCQANKKWTASKPTCTKVVCPDPGNVQYATKSGTYNYGDKVTYTPISGYEVKSGNAQRTCQADKSWSGTKPKVDKVGCQDPGVAPGAMRNGSSFVFGDSLTYWCKTGWNVTTGVPKITCKSDKTWNGPVLKCGRLSCGDPGFLVNGTTHGSRFLYEDVLNFTCAVGFEIKSGSNSRTCQASQAWTGSQPVCGKVQCPSPTPTGVQVSVGAKSPYEYMDEVTLSCMNGYKYKDGNTTGECLASGQWHAANLTCSNIDDCSPNPCKNGGACADGVASYTCTCTSEYTGTDCDTLKTTVNPLAGLMGGGAADVKPVMYALLVLAAAAKMLM